MKRLVVVVVAVLALAGCKVRPDGTVVIDEIPTGKPGTVFVWYPDPGYLTTEYGQVIEADGSVTIQR